MGKLTKLSISRQVSYSEALKSMTIFFENKMFIQTGTWCPDVAIVLYLYVVYIFSLLFCLLNKQRLGLNALLGRLMLVRFKF